MTEYTSADFHGDPAAYFEERAAQKALSNDEYMAAYWEQRQQDAQKALNYATGQRNIYLERLGMLRRIGNRALMPDEEREG